MFLSDVKAAASKITNDAADKLGSLEDVFYDAVLEAIKQAQEKLADQIDIDGFTKNIMALPDKIRIQSEVYRQSRLAFETAKSELFNAEAMLIAAIAAETTESGKQKYSNDNARRAELEIRKKNDFDYSMAWEPYKAALEEMERAQFDLDLLSNEFKAFQVVGNVLTARLSLMKIDL